MGRIVAIAVCACVVVMIAIALTPALRPAPAEISLPDLPGTDTSNDSDLVEQSERQNDDMMDVVPDQGQAEAPTTGQPQMQGTPGTTEPAAPAPPVAPVVPEGVDPYPLDQQY